uniref:Uncharacterized protein n=1 Tax=viral metagenome TaxID=1070528 RepID=A0A6C0C2K1_9ZZZZ
MTDKPSLKQYNPYSFFYISAIENEYMPTDASCNRLNGKAMENIIEKANLYILDKDWWEVYTTQNSLPLNITTTQELETLITEINSKNTNDPTFVIPIFVTEYAALTNDIQKFNYNDCFELGTNDDIIANEDIIKRCLNASLCRNRDRSKDYSEKMNRDGSSRQRYNDVKNEFNEEFMNSINLILGSLILGGLIFKQYYSK